MDLEQRLDEARRHDALTWEALLEHGLVPGGALTVDSFFDAGGEAPAGALAQALREAGSTASAESYQERAGLFRKRTVWSVQSSAVLPAASLEAVIDHSERMIRIAAEHGAQYDGWGAQIPAS